MLATSDHGCVDKQADRRQGSYSDFGSTDITGFDKVTAAQLTFGVS